VKFVKQIKIKLYKFLRLNIDETEEINA
jgi:hypothetical protein